MKGNQILTRLITETDDGDYGGSKNQDINIFDASQYENKGVEIIKLRILCQGYLRQIQEKSTLNEKLQQRLVLCFMEMERLGKKIAEEYLPVRVDTVYTSNAGQGTMGVLKN
jgi:hypothetical protein